MDCILKVSMLSGGGMYHCSLLIYGITTLPSQSFKLTGTKSMQAKIRRLANKFPNKVEGALRIEGEFIMTRSKRDFVPVDLGVLRSSGFVNDPVRNGRDISVTLGYGGAASAYALAVHEHPSEHSPPTWMGDVVNVTDQGATIGSKVTFHPAGRGPKYLERPLNEATPGLATRIAERINVEEL